MIVCLKKPIVIVILLHKASPSRILKKPNPPEIFYPTEKPLVSVMPVSELGAGCRATPAGRIPRAIRMALGGGGKGRWGPLGERPLDTQDTPAGISGYFNAQEPLPAAVLAPSATLQAGCYCGDESSWEPLSFFHKTSGQCVCGRIDFLQH